MPRVDHIQKQKEKSELPDPQSQGQAFRQAAHDSLQYHGAHQRQDILLITKLIRRYLSARIYY